MPIELSVNDSHLIRTDFSDDATWQAVCEAANAPEPDDGFEAFLVLIDDRQFDGATVESLLRDVTGAGFFFVADAHTITDPEHPILAVDCGDPESGEEPGNTFRVTPSEIWSPSANLCIGNMDFEEFASATDTDGVFRGFTLGA